MPGDLITLRGPDGDVVERPVAEAAGLIDRGYRAEQLGEKTTRLGEAAKEETYGGIVDKGATFATRALGSATLGLSDAIIAELGGADAAYDLEALRTVNPGTALAGTLTGAVLPSLVPGLGALPSARVSRIAGEIAGLGEGANLATRAAYSAGGAAFEGAAQNAGAYITDVALADKELSAEGFGAAMGQGAFYGGLAGGALTLGSGALTAARRLFPKVEMTAANVARAEREAIDEVISSLDDTATLKTSARTRLSEIRAERAAADPKVAAKLEEIKAAKLREVEAKADTAIAKADLAEQTAWKTKARAAKADQPAERAAKMATDEVEQTAAARAAPVAVDDATTALEQQLMGTKRALDSGKSLAEVGASRAARLEDSLNAHIASVDPEAARLVRGLAEVEQSGTVLDEWLTKYKGGQVGKFERSQAARDYAEGMRPKESGYYTKLPDGEPGSNMLVQRGYQKEFRGTAEEQAAAERAIDAKRVSQRDHRRELFPDAGLPTTAEEEAMVAERLGRPRANGEDIVRGEEAKAGLDDALGEAIGGKVKNIDDDVAESATVIGRHENASAELADALGPRAPTSSQARAAALKEAQASADSRATQASANLVEDIDKAQNAVSLPGVAAGKAKLAGAGDIGTAWEALHMMGVPVPDPRDIPVVGPLLSMYLKARVLGKAFGRFGGKVAATAETTIASKAAATQQRVLAAVDKMLEGGGKALGKAAPKTGGIAAALGHVLFDDRPAGQKHAPYTSEPGEGEAITLFHQRAGELARSQQPGAIAASVRDRVRASDPAIVEAITKAQEKKLGYLYETMPKADSPDSIMSSQQWMPAKVTLAAWTRRVEAADNPAGVLERAANGGAVTAEAVETLKAVYPTLYQAAQRRLIEQATEKGSKVPYQRRVQMSLLFDLPLDRAMDPEYANFLQESYQPKAQQAALATAQPAPVMGQPTIAAPVNLGQRNDPYQR